MSRFSVTQRTPNTVTWPWLVGSGALMIVCWSLLWFTRTYWNPLFFFGLWTGATLFVRALQGEDPLPIPRQFLLMLLSVPMWWWFELVNEFVHNWTYQGGEVYSAQAYLLFATLAFSTVVPALDTTWKALFGIGKLVRVPRSPAGMAWVGWEIAMGVVTQALVFILPAYFYPFVWVAPFLVVDGIAGLLGGPNLLSEVSGRRWRLPLLVGLAGMICGFFWEFWNFWAMPKWTYNIPFLHFFQIFEMPVLGYFGYVPFAWFTFQYVQLAERAYGVVLKRRRQYPGLHVGRAGKPNPD